MADNNRTCCPAGLTALQATPGWKDAVTLLQQDWDREGQRARNAAREYQARYDRVRGLMVLDVVLSRQRSYENRVLKDLARWQRQVEDDHGRATLKWLAHHRDACDDLGLRGEEKGTIFGCVDELLRYAEKHDLADDEDAACASWARHTAGLECAPGLDPYVGSVKGIGPALFAYMRMRSGGDGIKPDTRVLRRLQEIGLRAGHAGSFSALVLAPALAYELGISQLELDQLLWLRGQ